MKNHFSNFYSALILNLLLAILIFSPESLFSQISIKMQKESGVFSVPCTVNGLDLRFIFDTGASDVTISLLEAKIMFKNGMLTKEDIIGEELYQTATGEISLGTKINIREIWFSGIVIYNIEASIVNSLNAPLLLGQSAMKKLGPFQFNPNTGELLISENANKVDLRKEPINLENSLELRLVQEGDKYLNNNEGGKALVSYENASKANPLSALPFIKIGRLNVRARTYDDAVSAYKKALGLEPNNALAHKELGETYYLSKKNDLAKPEFKRYIELNRDDADAKIRFISFLFQNHEYEQVVSEATQMLQEDPSNYILLRSLSFSNFELKRYKDGYEYSKRFWENSSSNKIKPLDYIYSARLASINGDTVQALMFFKIALETEKNNPELASEYAKTLWQSKHYTDAVQQYNAKILQFGGGALDYYYLGRANFSAGNYLAGDKAFTSFLEIHPSSPDGFIWRAKCNSRIDSEMKTGAAFPFYRKFIELAQNDTKKNMRNLIEAYGYMGAYYLNSHDWVSAKQYLERALELDPNDKLAKTLITELK